MEYKTEIKYVRMSPRKMREVADMIRRLSLTDALVSLKHTNKKAAGILQKALKSAIKDAENNHKSSIGTLYLKSIEVNGGPTFKRWRPVSRGMAHPYLKRTSHIKIILTDEAR